MRHMPTSLPGGCGEGLVDCGFQIADCGLETTTINPITIYNCGLETTTNNPISIYDCGFQIADCGFETTTINPITYNHLRLRIGGKRYILSAYGFILMAKNSID